jgi:hypothetical protein
LIDALAAHGCDDAKLGKMRSDRIDDRRLLTNDVGRLHCLPHRQREPERPTSRYQDRLS